MKSAYYGYNFPFIQDGILLPMQSDERLVKNDIMQSLLTMPGERVMHTINEGSNVRKFVFELLHDGDIDDLRNEIIRIVKEETRVKLNDVVIKPNYDANYVEINVEATMVATAVPLTVTLLLGAQ